MHSTLRGEALVEHSSGSLALMPFSYFMIVWHGIPIPRGFCEGVNFRFSFARKLTGIESRKKRSVDEEARAPDFLEDIKMLKPLGKLLAAIWFCTLAVPVWGQVTGDP